MKKTLLSLLLIAGFCSLSTAQISIFEDFDSYTPGDNIVDVNPTYFDYWPGGTTGVPVSDEQSFSGSNSIYLAAPSGGSAQDVIMDFQDQYDSGTANLTFQMYVSPDHGAYFNVQAESVAGTTWASNVSFFRNGTVEFSNSDNSIAASAIFPQGEWFEISYKVNLDENLWELSMNGRCLASYANPANSFASMNLYPFSGSGDAEYWFDDISFVHSPDAEEITRDVGLSLGTDQLIGLQGDEFQNIATLMNNLGPNITSAVLSVDYNGNVEEIVIDNVDLGEGESLEIKLDTPYNIALGINELTVSVTSVNDESGDDVECNNTLNLVTTAIVPTPRRGVLVEEATGTWCPQCPRGAVAMEAMEEKYGQYFVGIAIHNDDPMAVTEIDNGFATIPGFTGYPNISIDRTTAFIPSNSVTSVEAPFIELITKPIRSAFQIGADLDETTNEVNISVEVEAIDQLNFADKLVIYIVEDHVTGETSDYDQANVLSGGTAMVGGYENLPDPVPADMMVYEFVARALLTPYAGTDLGVETIMEAGGSRLLNFNFTLDPEWDQDNISIVAVIIGAGQEIDNAMDATLTDAITNGFIQSSVNDPALQASFEVYPNPAADLLTIQLESPKTGDVQLELINIYGQTVKTERLQSFAGSQNWIINIADLPNGIYSARVKIGNRTAVKKVQKFSK